MSQWAVTDMAHPAVRDFRTECLDCLKLTADAIAHARATGSRGCTYTDEGTLSDGERHWVEVHRVLNLVVEVES